MRARGASSSRERAALGPSMSEVAAAALPAWDPLPAWLEPIAATLLAQRERWPHALLVTGPDGIGKRLLALHLARALLCEAPRPDRTPCRSCPACNWVEPGTPPDLPLPQPFP